MKKTYDLIVFGATGFTGQRAVQYLSSHLPDHVRWAIAGRNPSKLSSLAAQVGNIDTLTVDGQKRADVQSMVEQTQCVLSFAGPFCQVSSLVVQACAESGVHYVDITGESAWVADMMRKHEKTAQSSGAKILHSCGFDSVPADVGVAMLQRYFRCRWKTEVKDVEAFYYLRGGGLNGGTLASALAMMKQYDKADQQDPLLLAKDIDPSRVNSAKYQFRPSFNLKMKRWVMPFVMESVNSKVVYRSQHLADKGLSATAFTGVSKKLSYREFQVMKSQSQAFWGSMALGAFSVLGRFKPINALLKSLGPKAGEGPAETDIQRGCFDVKMVGVDSEGHYGIMEMNFAGDAGNTATVMFACEAVMTLLLHNNTLSLAGGFLTPATGLGDSFIHRLTDAHLKVIVDVYPRLSREVDSNALRV